MKHFNEIQAGIQEFISQSEEYDAIAQVQMEWAFKMEMEYYGESISPAYEAAIIRAYAAQK